MYELNLIKDRAIPPRRRKALYWSLLVYLGLCGALLVLVVYVDTYKMIAAVEYMREAREIRRTFSEKHPGEKDIISFARSLEREIQADIKKVQAIEDLVDRNAHLTRILLGLTVPMSQGITVDDFRLDHGTRKLTFTLQVPEDEAEMAMDLIAVWNASTNLNREVSRFETVSRNEPSREGQAMVLLEVEGTLKGKGS
jgi:hypothetical protein